MTRVTNMKLIPALCMGLFASYASASGFQLIEQNASGLGNAYAGSAAVAENASTIFYNPAGMTQLKDREISGGLVAVGTSFKFSDNGSSVGALAGSGNGGDGGGWGFVPNAYMSWALNKDLYLGVGVGAPFGLKTEYSNPWVGAAQSTMFDIKTYNVNPSIAYRVNDAFSIGGGVNWQRFSSEYTKQYAVINQVGAPSPAAAASPVKLTLDGDAWGWNVGGLWTLSPATKVGVSYRSAISYDLTGNINVSGPILGGASSNTAAKASVKLPDVFILSGTQQVSDKWQMLGDVSWTGWSSIPKIDVLYGASKLALNTDFRDTWRAAVGANYQYTDAIKLKFGVAYDQTPVKGAATRLVSLPDNDRTWFSAGAQWTPSKGSTLDFGVSYLYLKDAAIDNNQAATGAGRVTGTYSDSAWLLGVQYSMAF